MENWARPSGMPPDDTIAVVVPVRQFLVRAERVVVALSHVSAYPNGCMLDVQASARGGDATFDLFERMVFTVQFGAGITAEMDDEEPYRLRSRGQDALMLTKFGHQGGTMLMPDTRDQDRKADCTFQLWLAPLPPAEPGTLSVASPDLGPGPASCLLDGRAIAVAGAEAQPYWS